jgi:transcriptional regulator with XRE-family HTH domain
VTNFKKHGRLGRHYLKEWRLYLGLTQDQLVVRLSDPAIGSGITKGTISKIVNFKLPYTQHFLEACAEVFSRPVWELLVRDPSDEESALNIWNDLDDEQKPQATAVLRALRDAA